MFCEKIISCFNQKSAQNTSVRNIKSWNLLVSLIKYEEIFQCCRKLSVQKSALLLVGSREFDH